VRADLRGDASEDVAGEVVALGEHCIGPAHDLHRRPVRDTQLQQDSGCCVASIVETCVSHARCGRSFFHRTWSVRWLSGCPVSLVKSHPPSSQWSPAFPFDALLDLVQLELVDHRLTEAHARNAQLSRRGSDGSTVDGYRSDSNSLGDQVRQSRLC